MAAAAIFYFAQNAITKPPMIEMLLKRKQLLAEVGRLTKIDAGGKLKMAAAGTTVVVVVVVVVETTL